MNPTGKGGYTKGPPILLSEVADKFWAQAEKKESGCWLWTGKRNPRHDYGQFYVGWDGKRYREIRAHRASWMLVHGDIPKGQEVLHTCDTPLCVNPDHLFLGDKSANMRDAAKKGRLHWQKWKEVYEKVNGLFTREDVEALRCAALLLEDLKYHTAGRYQEVRTIADRIEALLPPDTGFTVTKPAEHASGSSGGSFSATTPAPPTEDQSHD